jgi:hypothetical protein
MFFELVQSRKDEFLIGKKKEVKIQLECTDVTPTTVARFSRPDKPPAKKLPAAGNGLDTHCWYCATENREADVIKTSSRLSLTRKRYENILGLFHVSLIFFYFVVLH